MSNTINLTELLSTLLRMDFSPLFDVTVDVDSQTKNFVFQVYSLNSIRFVNFLSNLNFRSM